MKKVGILGGTFDPPHYGHLLIANEVLQSLHLDEIWFLPNQEPPHKEKSNEVTNEERLEMIQLAIKDHPQFKLETIELERQGPSFTYDTMKLLKKRDKDIEFYFIIGADMIEYLPNWYKIDELLELVTFVGVNRPTYEKQTPYPILYVEVPDLGISSSFIRKRLKEGKSIQYLLPESVRLYIREKGLYGSK